MINLCDRLAAAFKKNLRGTSATVAPIPVPRLSRADKVLSMIKARGKGLEIGPSHRPLAPKSKGFDVAIVDHLDREGLLKKYSAHGLDCSQIEEVDYIWNGERYAELIGQLGVFDWIIASHLIEHTPDFIGFLQQCQEILKPDGCLVLVVPDKRYCFDKLRPKSGLAEIIDAHLQKRTVPSIGKIADYYLNVVTLDGRIAWNEEKNSGTFSFIHSKQDAEAAMKKAEADEYVDLHSWVFTPNSFRLIVNDLKELGYINMRETRFYDTEEVEFIVGLNRNGSGAPLDRLGLARKSLSEGY